MLYFALYIQVSKFLRPEDKIFVKIKQDCIFIVYFNSKIILKRYIFTSKAIKIKKKLGLPPDVSSHYNDTEATACFRIPQSITDNKI